MKSADAWVLLDDMTSSFRESITVPSAVILLLFLWMVFSPATGTCASGSGAIPELESQALAGNATAALHLGYQYWQGTSGPKHPERARQWLEKASAMGSGEADWLLGNFFLTGIPLKAPLSSAQQASVSLALQALERAASRGIASGAWLLGRFFDDGEIVSRNLTTAARWFEKGAQMGHAFSTTAFASILYRGDHPGYPTNRVAARQLFLIAAEKGDPVAQFELSKMYQTGVGGAEISKEALRWLKLALANGISNAGDNLGIFFLQGGGGLEPDLEQAMVYLKDAYRNNSPVSPAIQGSLFLNGVTGKCDTNLALDMFIEAARRGCPYGWNAMASLAEENGRDLMASVFFSIALESQTLDDSWQQETTRRFALLRKRIPRNRQLELTALKLFWKGLFLVLPRCWPIERPLLRWLGA